MSSPPNTESSFYRSLSSGKTNLSRTARPKRGGDPAVLKELLGMGDASDEDELSLSSESADIETHSVLTVIDRQVPGTLPNNRSSPLSSLPTPVLPSSSSSIDLSVATQPSQESASSSPAKPVPKEMRTIQRGSKSVLFRIIFGQCDERNFLSCPLKQEIFLPRYGVTHQQAKSFAKGNGTTNPERHLEHWHPKFYSQLLAEFNKNTALNWLETNLPKYQVEKSCLAAPASHLFAPTGTNVAKIWQAVFAVMSNIPFRAFDSTPYSEAFRCLGFDSASLTSHELHTKYLPLFTEVIKESLKEVLSTIAGFSLSFDGWTDISLVKYLVITVHWTTSDWLFEKAVLRLIPVSESLTAKVIHDKINKEINDYAGSNSLLMTAITDGAADVRSASLQLAGDDRIWCFDHLIDLVVSAAIDSYASSFQQMRDYIKAVRSSCTRRALLLQSQTPSLVKDFPDDAPSDESDDGYLPTSSGLMLILDVPTRWGSVYMALNRFLRLLPVLRALSDHSEFDLQLPPPNNLAILSDFRIVLQPFYDITKVSQTQRFPTCGYISVWYQHLCDQLTQIIEQVPSSTSISHPIALAKALKTLLDQRFKFLSEYPPSFSLCATALLPEYGQLPFPWMTPELRTAVWDKMVDDALNVLHSQEEDPNSLESLGQITSDDDNQDDLADDFAQFRPPQAVSLRSRVRDGILGIRAYWISNRKKIRELSAQDLAPLIWWKSNCGDFSPLIIPYIQAVFSAPGTSSYSECTVSAGPNIKTKLRNRIQAETLSNLIWLQRNLPLFYPSLHPFVSRCYQKMKPIDMVRKPSNRASKFLRTSTSASPSSASSTSSATSSPTSSSTPSTSTSSLSTPTQTSTLSSTPTISPSSLSTPTQTSTSATSIPTMSASDILDSLAF